MLQKAQEIIRKSADWALQEKHRQKAQEIRTEVEKAFTEHPKQSGESYLEHLIFTAKMSLHMIFVCLTLLTHGLFPFLFTRAASGQIENVYLAMRSRIPRPSTRRSGSNILHFRKKPPAEMQEMPRIAVVGSGFSGTMMLANLVRTASFPLIIEWYDEHTIPSGGIAYSTSENVHLLNVRADRMGAFAHEPQGFWNWLQSAEGKAAAGKMYPDKQIKPESFLPRILYGAYLKSIYDDTLLLARKKAIEINTIQAKVIDARLHNEDTQQLIISIEKGGITKETLVDTLVLATGNLPPRHFRFQNGMIREAKNYVGNVWETEPEHVFPDKLNQLSADGDIVIIGTGLTMVDTMLTIKRHGYKGTVTAISRHGWLPAAHAAAKPYPLWEWTDNPEYAPSSTFAMLKRIRQEIKKAAAAGHDWRSVIDSLRPITQKLWQKLTITEKRKFVSRLFTLWNIHRHRMAPEICTEIKEMQHSGTLRIIPGRIYYVGSDEQGMTVAYRKRGANRVETIRAMLVLNCTGPEYDIVTSTHRLLRNLLDRGLVTVGPLRMGIEGSESGGVKGKASEAIFAIGTLQVGDLLECTAVPELRELADNTAQAVIARLNHLKAINSSEEALGAWI